MTIRILKFGALVGAILVASLTLAFDGASAVTPKPAPPKAPRGYHLDGFKGWENGYRV